MAHLGIRLRCHEEGHVSDTSDAGDVGGTSRQVTCIESLGTSNII